MQDLAVLIIAGLVITNFLLLGSSRLGALIRLVAVQGILLGVVPFAAQATELSLHTGLLALISMSVKGVLIPIFLVKALRGVQISREAQPYVGFVLSTGLGIVMTVFAFYVGGAIPMSTLFPMPSLISLAIAMGLTGIFLICSRRQAITQIIGYLVLENGTYVFGMSLGATQSLLVEMGILLDVLVAVFIMGIVTHHINREFDTISTQTLETLKR